MKEIQPTVKLNVAAFVLAVAATLCFPQILNLKGNELAFTNSIFTIFFLISCFLVMKLSLTTIDFKDARGWAVAGILSFLFTVAMLFGARLDYMENVYFQDAGLWISLPVLTCFFTVIVRKLWTMLNGLEQKKRQQAGLVRTSVFSRIIEKYPNIATFFFLLLCWIPVFLAVYPGFFVYDAQQEYTQVVSRAFTTHHPLLHELLLGGIICAVHKVTGTYNWGIACYTLLQMAVVSGVLTYLLSYLRRKKVSKIIRGISLLYFGFFPVILMFTLCSSKDTPFTIALLALVISLIEMGINQEKFFASKGLVLIFIASAFFMLMFRKNGIYAFVVMVPILLLYHKGYRKKLVGLCAIIFAGYFLANGFLISVLHASDSENQEILTVPIQQLARTYMYNEEVFSTEDKAELYEILPEEALQRYKPRLSDVVKNYFNNEAYSADKLKYAKLWVRIGLRKPHVYLNAWLMTSYGFWYPDMVVNVYSGHVMFTITYEDSSYFGYEVELPGVRNSKIPWLDEVYRKLSLELVKEKIPVISMLFSPGCLFWCFTFVFCYALYRRRYHIVVPYLLVLLVWLTVILGPTYLPRYVLIFWYGLPLFAAVLFEEEKFAQQNRM